MRIEVVNWGEFQHYTKRLPPWIKLHRSLLNKREWHALSGDASKLLAECWLIAAEHKDGWIEKSTADLAWRLRRGDHETARLLKELEAQGFVALINHDASDVLARCQQDATPETETERETKQSSVSNETGEAPKEITRAEAHKLIAPLIREHIWLGDKVPVRVLDKNPGWKLGNELSIADQWAKDYGWPVVLGVIPLLRRVVGVEPDVPLSLLWFNAKEKRGKLSEAIGLYQRQAELDAMKKPSSFRLGVA